MTEQEDISFPESPMEMASWVRDRSMKVVKDLAGVINVVKHDLEIPDDLQPSLHFPLSAALANAIKLAAFSSGHHITTDELSSFVGAIYERGADGFDELVVRLSSLEEPLGGSLHIDSDE
ncbi:MAG: hypothetical protein HYU52_00025 [Acidobacteria bacterium]|nr:hypothetical protein [Acidobacteriota bacterium]